MASELEEIRITSVRARPTENIRYFFKLYALDTKLDLEEKATKLQVERAMEDHILNQSELMGRYERK